MSSRPVFKFYLTHVLGSTAILLSAAACSSNGGAGADFSLAANPAIEQPQPNPPGDDMIDTTPGGGGGGGGASRGLAPQEAAIGDAGTAVRVVGGVDTLLSTGNADLGGLLGPLAPATRQVDAALNPLAQVVVADRALIGPDAAAGSQAVALSALSNGQTSGQLATVGLLTPGQIASLSVAGSPALVVPATAGGLAPSDVAALSLGGQSVLGSATTASPALVGVGLGSAGAVPGQLVSGNVTPDGSLGVTVGSGVTAPASNGLVLPIQGVATVGVLSGGSLVSVNGPILSGLGR